MEEWVAVEKIHCPSGQVLTPIFESSTLIAELPGANWDGNSSIIWLLM
jgi:hypothetical protein